jgi:hypothetical protein
MKELFKNCLFVDEVDGWYIPSRFTRKQLEYYRKEFATLIRSTASSSVALRFSTSATKLTFDYKIVCKARNWAVIDVVCDGKRFSSLSLDADEGVAELTLPGNPDSEITVFLPHLVSIKIKNIEADAPLVPVTDTFLRWLALGDSITQGMVARSPLSPYPSAISAALGSDLLNAAVGGIEGNVDHDIWYIEPGKVYSTRAEGKKDPVSIGECKVEFDQSSYKTKNHIAKPEIKVTNGDKKLRRGRDYIASFVKNTGSGTGYAIVRGKGRYKDWIAVPFTID